MSITSPAAGIGFAGLLWWPDNYAAKEDFQSDPIYRRDFSTDFVLLCFAASRVLQGDGYIVINGEGQNLTAGKEFQIEDKSHAIL